MDIILSAQSDKPIYEQIYVQIKKQIMNGRLTAGSELPSMRVLAKDLKVSVITTKKAYEELIKDGFVVSFKAKGCYVAELDMDFLRDQTIKQIKEELGLICQKAKNESVSLEELKMLLIECFGEE